MVSENWSIRDWKRIVYAIGVCRRLSIIVGTVKASRGEYLIGLGIPQVIIYYDITVRFTTYCCIFLSNSSSFSPSSAFIAGVRTFPCGIESEQVFNCIDYSKSFIRVRFFRTIVSLRFLLFFNISSFGLFFLKMLCLTTHQSINSAKLLHCWTQASPKQHHNIRFSAFHIYSDPAPLFRSSSWVHLQT